MKPKPGDTPAPATPPAPARPARWTPPDDLLDAVADLLADAERRRRAAPPSGDAADADPPAAPGRAAR
jgi:hypothetical protein